MKIPFIYKMEREQIVHVKQDFKEIRWRKISYGDALHLTGGRLFSHRVGQLSKYVLTTEPPRDMFWSEVKNAPSDSAFEYSREIQKVRMLRYGIVECVCKAVE